MWVGTLLSFAAKSCLLICSHLQGRDGPRRREGRTQGRIVPATLCSSRHTLLWKPLQICTRYQPGVAVLQTGAHAPPYQLPRAVARHACSGPKGDCWVRPMFRPASRMLRTDRSLLKKKNVASMSTRVPYLEVALKLTLRLEKASTFIWVQLDESL